MISGIVTAVLLLAFIGIAVWAYSSRQKQAFKEAAELPLKDDAAPGAGAGKEHRP